MKKISLFAFVLLTGCLSAQIPQNYESNLSLHGRPKAIREYYYHRLAQIRGHFYNHQLSYNSLGQVIKHQKTNEGLYDTIPDLFEGALPPIGTTVYNFAYDSKNRLIYFENKFTDSSSQITTQRDEAWVYDEHQMLIQRNYWEWSEGTKIIKNPSYQRVVTRDDQNRIVKIEKNSYSFLDRGLSLSEIILYKYKGNMIDSIIIYQKNDQGYMALFEKRYNLTFSMYNALNTDSLLLKSYTSMESDGYTYSNILSYDDQYRQTLFDKRDVNGVSVLNKEWIFEPYMTAMIFNGTQRFENHYDASGSLTFQENFTKYDDEWFSDEVPLEVIERNISDEKVTFATIKLWDQDQPFYRKKADFEYVYETPTWETEELYKNAVYPNPCQGILHIKDIGKYASLTLIGYDGRASTLPLQETVLLEVASGLYIMKMGLKDGSYQNVKLVVD